MSIHDNIWQEVCQRIKNSDLIMDVQYTTWIQPVEKVKFGTEFMFLWAPNSVAKSSIEDRYAEIIKDAVFKVTKKYYKLKVLVHGEEEPLESEADEYKKIGIKRDETLLNPKYTFDNFIVGNSNRYAHAYALSVAEAPGGKYNPLFLYGGAGLGKTHLCQAIGNFFKAQRADAKVIYVSSEKYTNEFITSLQNKTTDLFREKYRSADILIVDDIQFIAGKESTVEEFFHTFNELYENSKQIVLTSDRPPNEIHPIEERMKSRFAWGLTSDITPPDFETRIAILKNKAQSEGISFSDEVYVYIADNIKSNIRELEGALNKIIAYKNINVTEQITEETAAIILKDLVYETDIDVTVDMVKHAVCKYFNISVDDLMGESRKKEIATARQLAMYLCSVTVKKITSTAIGKAFERKHSTTLYAINKVESDIKTDEEIKTAVNDIKNIIFG